MNQNQKKLNSFIKYCEKYPEERFFQALRNWSGVPYILKSSHFNVDMFNEKFVEKNKKTFDISDTFYEK